LKIRRASANRASASAHHGFVNLRLRGWVHPAVQFAVFTQIPTNAVPSQNTVDALG
jgi:hypothetical protein